MTNEIIFLTIHLVIFVIPLIKFVQLLESMIIKSFASKLTHLATALILYHNKGRTQTI